MTKAQSLRVDFGRQWPASTKPSPCPKIRSSAIQRFEISFELCWKFLKAYFVAPGLLSVD